MQKKHFTRKLFLNSFLAGLCCFSITSWAAPTQVCDLGNTCPIPGDDNHETLYNIKPADGFNYVCEIKSTGGNLVVLLTSTKDFTLLKGGGLYNVNSDTTVELEGRFKQPDDPNTSGEIKIARLPLTATGTVKCYAKA